MIKTWLMRRPVRRPVDDAVTARMSSSVCRLPFISSSPLASRMSCDRLGRRRVAVGRVDHFEAADIELMFAGDREDFRRRAHEDRNNKSGLGRLHRPPQRGLVARVRNHRVRGRSLFRSRNQTVVL